MGQWTRPKSINERILTNQRIIFSGDVGGKIRTFPVGTGAITDDQEIADSGGGPDIYFYNQTHTVTTTGDQTVTLKYVPLAYSEHVYWCPNGGGGIYLEEGEDWQKTTTSSLVVNGSYLSVGDQIVVEYAYEDTEPVEDESSTFTIIRASGAFFDYGGTGPTVVGTTPLADGSDSTYIECVESGYQSWTVALETLGAYTPGTPINLHLRVGYLSGVGTEDYWNQLEVKVTTDQEGLSDAGFFSDNSLLDGGIAYATPNNSGVFTIYDFVIPFYPHVVETEAYLVSALQAGAFLNVDYAYNGDTTIPGPTFYEASIWIG